MWDTFWLTVSEVSGGHFEPEIEKQDAANLINTFKAFEDEGDDFWLQAVNGASAARNAPAHFKLAGNSVKEFNDFIKKIVDFMKALEIDEAIYHPFLCVTCIEP
ncbi:hypothetical protein TrLO_g9859 [Triparma laevis f. longispina]|uniref:Uncharacterized protein n=1 Tax=Triparma laevis f. longispina TaxID=1714387 RepID=A0A9W7FDR2_9STRA|nr:hypothetical protein TrLO_g9859 [Triparma laevis f. longispina]